MLQIWIHLPLCALWVWICSVDYVWSVFFIFHVFIFTFIFLLYNISQLHLPHSSLLPVPLSLPSPPDPLCSLLPQKRAGLSGTVREHRSTRYYKTKHKTSHQGWVRQASRRKGVLRAGKESETPQLPLSVVPQEHQANKQIIHAEDIAWTHADSYSTTAAWYYFLTNISISISVSGLYNLPLNPLNDF